jgi:hypothetical protein
VLRHPLGPLEMALKRSPGAIEFTFRVEMQHYSCDVTPVGAFAVRVEQPEIRDEVFLVIGGQCDTGGPVSVMSGSNGGNCMGGLATLWMIHQACLGSRKASAAGGNEAA